MNTRIAAPVVVQRNCGCGGKAGPEGECATCRAKRLALQRRSAGTHGRGTASSHAVAQGLSGSSGAPLSPSIRQTMERRLGKAAQANPIETIGSQPGDGIDSPGPRFERAAEKLARDPGRMESDGPAFQFDSVRIHADGAADRLAQGIGADAFTVGTRIAFRSGRFDPVTAAGQELLAHELTHVLQQRASAPRAQRQPTDDYRMRYEDRVSSTIHEMNNPMGVWRGDVERASWYEQRHETPATDKKPASSTWTTISSRSAKANVEFDPTACRVRLPLRLKFHNPSFKAPQAWDPCANDPANPTPRTPLPAATFSSLRSQFTSQLNSGLNGWYTAKIEGCAKGPCAGKEIPIVVDLHDGGAAEDRDQDVWLINATGRSCAGSSGAFIYAPGGKSSRRMWVHEGGHFVLGYGDEYEEEGKPKERVTHDYSAMGDAEETRFASFHQRHFAHVPVFLNSVLADMGHAGCHAKLVESDRSLATSFNFTLAEGVMFAPGSRGGYLDLGFELGRSSDRDRALEKIVGIHGRFLALSGEKETFGFLLGVRLGLNQRWGGSGHAFSLGGFTEFGGGAFDLGADKGPKPLAYGELGAGIGYKPPQTAWYPGVRLEGAVGGQIGAKGTIGDPTGGVKDLAGPPDKWVRFGLSAVWDL